MASIQRQCCCNSGSGPNYYFQFSFSVHGQTAYNKSSLNCNIFENTIGMGTTVGWHNSGRRNDFYRLDGISHADALLENRTQNFPCYPSGSHSVLTRYRGPMTSTNISGLLNYTYNPGNFTDPLGNNHNNVTVLFGRLRMAWLVYALGYIGTPPYPEPFNCEPDCCDPLPFPTPTCMNYPAREQYPLVKYVSNIEAYNHGFWGYYYEFLDNIGTIEVTVLLQGAKTPQQIFEGGLLLANRHAAQVWISANFVPPATLISGTGFLGTTRDGIPCPSTERLTLGDNFTLECVPDVTQQYFDSIVTTTSSLVRGGYVSNLGACCQHYTGSNPNGVFNELTYEKARVILDTAICT